MTNTMKKIDFTKPLQLVDPIAGVETTIPARLLGALKRPTYPYCVAVKVNGVEEVIQVDIYGRQRPGFRGVVRNEPALQITYVHIIRRKDGSIFAESYRTMNDDEPQSVGLRRLAIVKVSATEQNDLRMETVRKYGPMQDDDT